MDLKAAVKSIFASLQFRNFRYFWIGQCISLLGTWMQRTALVWLAYTLTGSPFCVGLIGVCRFTPLLLFTLFSGVIIERTNKRHLLCLTQILLMLQALALGFLSFTHTITYFHILLLSCYGGIVQTFDMPARQAFLTELVGDASVMNAVSLNSTIANLAKIVGPAIAGLVMLHYGNTACFFFNALSFGAMLIALCAIKISHPVILHSARRDMLKNIKEGISYIKKRQNLVFNVIFMSIICTFSMNNSVIVPVFTKTVLHMNEAAYGTLMSAAGVGALFGALFMSARAKKGINKRLFCFSMLLVTSVQVFLFVIDNYLAALVLVSVIGFGNLVFMNMCNSIFQLNSEPVYRGRVMSIYSFLNQGSTPIGNFYAGTVMEHFGGRWGFPGCGFVALLLLFTVFFWKKDELKKWFETV